MAVYITLEHKPFATAMAALSRLVIGRNELLSQVKIGTAVDRVAITATNEHIFATYVLPAKIEEEGVEVVPASLLNSLLRGSTSDVELRKEAGPVKGNVSGSLRYRSGRVKGSLACYADPDLFPRPRPLESSVNKIVLPASMLAEMISSVSPFSDHADAATLNRQHISVWVGVEGVKMLCSDSYRFGRYRWRHPSAIAETDLLLAASDAQTIVPFLSALGEEEVDVVWDERAMEIRAATTTLRLPLGWSESPPVDYFQWQAGRTDRAEYEVNPKNLLDSLQIVMSADSGSHIRVRLTALPEEILLSAKGGFGEAEHRAHANPLIYDDTFSVIVQGGYLRDMLRACPSEKLRFAFSPINMSAKQGARAHNSIYAVTDDGQWDHFLMLLNEIQGVD